MSIITNFKAKQLAKNSTYRYYILDAAKHGESVFENEVNKLYNLKVNRKKKFTVQDIFSRYWDSFIELCSKKNIKIRNSILDNVDKMIHCKDFSRGYLFFECPNCHDVYYQGLSCNSRFCPSCGIRYREERTKEISKVCINRPHRQFVFSIAEELRPYFRIFRELYDILFQSVDESFKYLLTSKTKKAKKNKHAFGYVSFLHTFGRDLKDNPHIHVLICEAYMDKNDIIHKYEYFNFETLRKSFMRCLLNNIYYYLKANAPEETKKFYQLKSSLYKKYKDGFYTYGPKLKQNSKIATKSISKYIARYVSHPAIAESRITNVDYNNNTVSYFYDPHEDDHIEEEDKKLGRQYITENVFTFISKLIKHIPDKGFHTIRYCGFYSNRTTKRSSKYESLYTKNEIVKLTNDNHWQKHMINTYHFDPLLCHCGTRMILDITLSFLPTGGRLNYG